MQHAIRPNNEEEIKAVDLEMEDAQTEEEKEMIRADRALAKQNETPFSRQFNEESENRTLLDLACQPCGNEDQEDQQDEEKKTKQIKQSGSRFVQQ